MSELVKSFQDAYALPWTIKHYGEFDAIFSAGELRLCYVSRPDTERKRAAMSYLVQCANLMPEAVEVIKDLVKIVSQPDYDPDSLDYADYVVWRAEGLLAKLEGGADDEAR